MINNIVGDNIRRLRENLNITQEELAFRCDLTQGHINYIENGKRGFTKKSLEKIAKALGVQTSLLFEKGKEPSAKVAEPVIAYGKRSRIYNEIAALLDKLPDAVVNHYKTILSAEVAIRKKGL